MAVYCVPKSDEHILSDVAASMNILAVACPSCANISYYLSRKDNGPIMKFTLKGIEAQSCKKEMHRLVDLLTNNGKNVESSY